MLSTYKLKRKRFVLFRVFSPLLAGWKAEASWCKRLVAEDTHMVMSRRLLDEGRPQKGAMPFSDPLIPEAPDDPPLLQHPTAHSATNCQ